MEHTNCLFSYLWTRQGLLCRVSSDLLLDSSSVHSHRSLFQAISWTLHLSKRPVKSGASAEVLASSAAVDEGKTLASAYQPLVQTTVKLAVIVDSKDLFHSISTSCTTEDKSIAADIHLMRYNFESHRFNRLIWIPRRRNPADLLTKTDSPLSNILQLMLINGSIPTDLSMMKSRESAASLG